MVTPTYEKLHKNVFYFPGIIANIDLVMSELDEVNSLSITPWEIWYANNDAKENPYGDLKTLSYSKLSEETDSIIREKSEFVLNSILGAMEESCRVFMEEHNAPKEEIEYMTRDILNGDHVYGIRRYNENLGMGLHPDYVSPDRDTYTVAVYLDDDYDGGELVIAHEDIFLSIKNIAGSIVVFPSKYLHESKNLTRGRKTIITHVHMPMGKILED